MLQPLDLQQRVSLEADSALVQETWNALGNLVVDTEIDQLIGREFYSGFSEQDALEELQAVANTSGWPNPPDFSLLPQRVREKQPYLNAVIFEIQMISKSVSKFYKHLFTMSVAERYAQSLEIMSTG